MCEIYLSLCGHILTAESIKRNNLKEEGMFQIFEEAEHLVTQDMYLATPSAIIADKRLLVCIEDQIYVYSDAI